jgi:tetratricopeptide (TPR) repeat protein
MGWAIGLALATSGLEAQMGTGRINGTVTDQDGKPIAGATIVAEARGGGQKLEAQSDDKGEWGILGFRTGQYTFTVSADGYQPESINAQIQQMQRNPKMEVILRKLQKGEAFGGEEASALLNEGNQFFEQKLYAEALVKYQELLAENPTLYQVNLNIGNVYRAMEQPDQAIEAYQKVLADEPTHLGALVNMGELHIKKGELEKAVTYFEKAIEQAPGDEAIPFNVAEIYFNTGNVEKAIEYYEKSSAAKPDWPDPVLKLGFAYLNAGDMEKAVAQMEKVMTIAPDSAQAAAAKGVLDTIKK